jgi:hypothetical protein
MNPPHPPAGLPPDRAALEALLCAVQQRFYPTGDPARRAQLHRDRRHLIHALCWPAAWLRQRGLTCSQQRYHALLVTQLDAISTHGDPRRYSAYFPAYLLKCLQDHFRHHGDTLYDELKHLRNALDRILASPALAARVQHHAEHLDLLATAHRLTRPQPRRTSPSDCGQLPLL